MDLKEDEAKAIEEGSEILNKKYDSKEFYELIYIRNCFPEFKREKIKKYLGLFI